MTDRVSDLSAAELLERAAKLAGWDEGNLPVTLHFVGGVVRCETVEPNAETFRDPSSRDRTSQVRDDE